MEKTDGCILFDAQAGKTYNGMAQFGESSLSFKGDTINPGIGLFSHLIALFYSVSNASSKPITLAYSEMLRVRKGPFDKYPKACFIRMKSNDVYVFVFDQYFESLVHFLQEKIGQTEE